MTVAATSLTDRVRHGVRWSAGAQYAGMAVRLGVAVVLARLLGPAEFGVMALAMAIIGVAALVQESGLGAALVQYRGRLEPAALAMLLLTSAGGVLLATAVWAGAPTAAAWLAQPRLEAVLRAMAGVCLVRALAQTPRALLQRDLRFRALATLDLCATVAYGAVGVALAASGVGVWSLVAGQLATEVTLALGVWGLHPVPLRRGVDRSVVRELARFGRPVMAANLLSLLHAQLPTLVAGRLLGAVPLGFYAMANRWASLPVLGITYVAGRVAYPALARIGDDRARLASAWLRVLGTVLALAVPVAIGLAVLADPLVRTLYDPRWFDAIVPLCWLAFFGLFHATAATTGEVFKAAGRPRWVAGWALVYVLLQAGALLWLVPRSGLVGLAVAATLAPGVVMVGSVLTAARLLSVSPRALVGRVVPPLAGALALAAAATTARALVRLAGAGPAAELLAGALAGALAYALALGTLAPAALDEVRALVGAPPRRKQIAPARHRGVLRGLALAGLAAIGLALSAEAALRLAARGASRAALAPWSERRPWEALRSLVPDVGPMPIAGGHAAWRLQPWNPEIDYRLDADGFRVAGAEGGEGAPVAAAGDGARIGGAADGARIPAATGTAGGCHVVVIGDSNAFGYGVPAADALGAQLARQLGSAGRSAAVDNAGLCGANVRHLVPWTRRTVARTQPDVVLVVLSPWSLRTDLPAEPATRADRLADEARRGWLPFARWSALAERTGWYASHWLARTAGWPSHSVVAWELEPLHEPAGAFAQRWEESEPALDALLAAAIATGARPLLVWVPLDVQVERARNVLYRDARLPYPTHGFVDRDYTHDRRYQRVLAAWAAARGVALVDATHALRAAGEHAFLADDYHLSAAGHAAVARTLAAAVAAACHPPTMSPVRTAGAAPGLTAGAAPALEAQ